MLTTTVLAAVRSAPAAAAATHRCSSSSALSGNRDPMDVVQHNPLLSQPQSTSSRSNSSIGRGGDSQEDSWRLAVPGVVGPIEPNIPHPGSVNTPNPRAALLQREEIAKVTHDGDVTVGSAPSPPGDSQPRN